MDELRRLFRPEFLNRVDDTVLFSPLSLEAMERIVELALDRIQNRLAEREIRLEVTAEALRFIAREAYDPVYGARPVHRFLKRRVETELGRRFIRGEFRDRSTVSLNVERDELTFRSVESSPSGAYAAASPGD